MSCDIFAILKGGILLISNDTKQRSMFFYIFFFNLDAIFLPQFNIISAFSLSYVAF